MYNQTVKLENRNYCRKSQSKTKVNSTKRRNKLVISAAKDHLLYIKCAYSPLYLMKIPTKLLKVDQRYNKTAT